MKTFIFAVTVFAVLHSSCHAAGTEKGAAAKPAAPQFTGYTMDKDYFSCAIPSGWRLEREKARDEKYKIYEIELIAPVVRSPASASPKSAPKAGLQAAAGSPTAIYVSYYAKDNADFSGYKDFIERNSANILGETKNERESYSPVKQIKLNGRAAFELSRAKLAYLHPESKSGESVKLKEKLYVLPAIDGFYVLHFTASAAGFQKSLNIFEKVAGSFKGKP
ncbi:MAG: hypothetical protein WCW52_04805 [Elusimicrobiales bacterium]|jgi:hypothetical protein